MIGKSRAISPPQLVSLVVPTTVLGLAHHVDHIIRGNHVGWPLIPEVNGFTFSWLIYPAIAVGVWLTRRGTVGYGYWAVLFGLGTVFVGAVHVLIERPPDIVGPYASAAAGWIALGILAAFLLTLAGTAMAAAAQWARTRTSVAPRP